MDANRCSNAAIEVHSELGVGLLESAYELALATELRIRGIKCERQVLLPAIYKGIDLGDAYRLDLVVEDCLVIEIKAVRALQPIHTAQLVTYLRLSRKPLGLILNFHAQSMRLGLARVANTYRRG